MWPLRKVLQRWGRARLRRRRQLTIRRLEQMRDEARRRYKRAKKLLTRLRRAKET